MRKKQLDSEVFRAESVLDNTVKQIYSLENYALNVEQLKVFQTGAEAMKAFREQE